MVNLTDDEKLELGIYIEQVIHEEIQKIIQQEARAISQKIESQVELETNITTLTDKILSKSSIKGFAGSIRKMMEHYLDDLESLQLLRDEIRKEMIESLVVEKDKIIEASSKKIEGIIEDQKETIKSYAHNAYELTSYIENTKSRIVNDIVSEATKRIEIEDVRPRTIEIYQNGTLEKTLNSELYLEGACIAAAISKEEMEKYHVLPKHLDGIVSQLRVTKDVEAAIFLYENEDGSWKVSMRSNEKVDVAAIAVKHQGGGHVRAAGATMTGTPKEIIQVLCKEIKEQL